MNLFIIIFFFGIAFTFSKCHSTFCTQLSGYNGHENSLFYLDWPVHFATKVIKAIKKTPQNVRYPWTSNMHRSFTITESVNHNVSVPANFSSQPTSSLVNARITGIQYFLSNSPSVQLAINSYCKKQIDNLEIIFYFFFLQMYENEKLFYEHDYLKQLIKVSNPQTYL